MYAKHTYVCVLMSLQAEWKENNVKIFVSRAYSINT